MSESAPSTVTEPAPAPAPEPKKAPSQAKLESLAKARAAKSKYRSERKVVKDDDSANELLDRVARSDPDAAVTKRSYSGGKRKSYEGRGSFLGNGTTIKYVIGAAAIAGLAYLGSSGFKSMPSIPSVPTSTGTTPPPEPTQQPGGPQPANVSVVPSGNVSLSTGTYYG